MRLIWPGVAFSAAAQAAGRTSAPPGCLVVTKSPLSGQHGTIQAAVNALSTSPTEDRCIWIDQGTYAEQVLVGPRSVGLAIYGYTTDTSSYAENRATITANHSQAEGLSNDETATLRVKAADFRLYNVNVANSHGRGSQAVALSATANSGYYGCSFTGFQDTLLADVGSQLYSRCLIQGATDFIFGQHAPAWFEKCDIRVLAASRCYVTGMADGADSISPKDGLLTDSTDSNSQRPGLVDRCVVLRLQRQHSRCGLEPERAAGRLLSWAAVEPVCAGGLPAHSHERRHQRGGVARLGRGGRAYRQCALRGVCQLRRRLTGRACGLRRQAGLYGVHLDRPHERVCP